MAGHQEGRQVEKQNINKSINKYMECNHGKILTAVYAMRQAQKQYFRTRDKADLKQSKALEVKVDEMLLEAATGTTWVEVPPQPPKGPHVAPTPGLFDISINVVPGLPGAMVMSPGDRCEKCGSPLVHPVGTLSNEKVMVCPRCQQSR